MIQGVINRLDIQFISSEELEVVLVSAPSALGSKGECPTLLLERARIFNDQSLVVRRTSRWYRTLKFQGSAVRGWK